jgi:predicted neutral ceramidase superfamily lipid hydrolase
MRRLFTASPLLVFPVLIYTFVASFAGKPDAVSATPMTDSLSAAIFRMPMISGEKWVFDRGDSILFFALIMLFVEIIKSTNTRALSMINHGLSMGIFVVSLIAFLLIRNFATSVFFMLLVMMLLDVVAGFMVSIVSARRDFGVGSGLID